MGYGSCFGLSHPSYKDLRVLDEVARTRKIIDDAFHVHMIPSHEN